MNRCDLCYDDPDLTAHISSSAGGVVRDFRVESGYGEDRITVPLSLCTTCVSQLLERNFLGLANAIRTGHKCIEALAEVWTS